MQETHESEFLEPFFLERAREGVECWAARTDATRFDLRNGLPSVVTDVGGMEMGGNDGDSGEVKGDSKGDIVTAGATMESLGGTAVVGVGGSGSTGCT